MRSGGLPAGSSRALRLDPFALPLRFAASDIAADERVRHVELTRERVVVRRQLAGMRMALNMPVSAFIGVTVRLLPPEGEAAAAVAVILEHRDPALALPLFIDGESDDVMTQWQDWASVLGLPQIVEDQDGGWRKPFAQPLEPEPQATGAVVLQFPAPRRFRHGPLKKRRPSMSMRRRSGPALEHMPVHRSEREIIARD
jgi:hypothetical protein